MKWTKNWRGIYLVVLLQVLHCQGASLERRGEQPAETIVAVAGISPALLDTAISLFDPNHGKNWNFAGSLAGGKDKHFPFPLMMEPPQPLRPLLSPVSRPKPQIQPPQINQQSGDEKDQGGTGTLVPLKPLQPLEVMEPLEGDVGVEPMQPLQVENVQHEVDTETLTGGDADDSHLFHPDAVPALDPIPEVEEAPAELETLSVSPSVPESSTTANNGWGQGSNNNGWTQGSQGGHQSGGNQILSMFLAGTDADFATTSDVNIHVVSEGASSSSTHMIGQRGDPNSNSKPHHHHHQGQAQTNGVTKYNIRFKSKE